MVPAEVPMMWFCQTLQFIAALGLLAYLAWLFSKRVHSRSELLRQHLEGRNRFLERFGSGQEFLDFARTEEGHALLEAPQLPAPAKAAPAGLRLFQLGVVAMLVGAAFNEVYYASMGWRSANLHLNEEVAWSHTISAMQWSRLFLAVGGGLMIGGILAALCAYVPRLWNRKRA